MKKIRSFFRSPMGTTLLFMLAVLFIMTGTIGGVRAVPRISSEDYAYAGVELDQIGITLLENGNEISSRDYSKDDHKFVEITNTDDSKWGLLLDNLLGENEKFKLGKKYTEELSVKNSNEIAEFVRVTVYRYWVDKDGNRFDVYDKDGKDILNSMIDLHFLEGNGWVIDHNSDTKERTVLYYQNVLNAETVTPLFADTLRIDNSIVDYAEIKTTTTGTGSYKTATWVADGLKFMIEVEADGVQNHNATAAIKSAWGLTDADIGRLGLNIR